MRWWAVGLALATAGPAAPIRAQPVTEPAAADAAAAVRAARRAQRTFEAARRAALPVRDGDAPACEERIGRFCWWDNNGEPPPAEEPAAVGRAREALLVRLADAAAAAPADGWIAGQRVRYLAESRRWDAAVAAAGACRAAEPGWCAALRGLALHQRGDGARGDPAAAAAAFDSAVAALPPKERCAWRDVDAWLADDGTRRALRALPCGSAARAAWEARFWRLTQPLWVLEANDLRNEFDARRTMARITREGATTYAVGRGRDVDELELRYGWPTAWSRRAAPVGLAEGAPSITGHEPTPSYDFVPRAAALADPTRAPADAWAPAAPRARMRYAPRWATRGLTALPHQLARFRRGDSTLHVAAWDVTADTGWGEGAARAGLALADESGAVVAAAARTVAAGRGALAVASAPAERLLSLELLGDAGRAVRARLGVAPLPPGAPLSDLLLLRGGAAGGPPALEGAVAAAAGAPTVRVGETVGLYWESYRGSTPAAPASATLTATRHPGGWLARVVARATGETPQPVALRFEDPGRGDGAPGRTLAVTWPAAPPGWYRVALRVRWADGTEGASAVDVQVTR